jgi:hypothetical protein
MVVIVKVDGFEIGLGVSSFVVEDVEDVEDIIVFMFLEWHLPAVVQYQVPGTWYLVCRSTKGRSSALSRIYVIFLRRE